ncbi:MAG TPA: hypothetical protein VFA04_05285 [Bryobacteraceae bacterium]|nr:hypothetical protein [Bryobacteraceae bacterium]
MKSTLTRREAGLLLMTASAVSAQNPQTPHPGPGADEDPAAAVEQRRRESAEQLAKFKLPFATEPAFEFRP